MPTIDKILEEFEKEFTDVLLDEDGMHIINNHPLVIPVMNKSDIKTFLRQALTTQREEFEQALRDATRDAEAGRELLRTVKYLYEQSPTALEIAIATYNKRIKE